MKRKKSPLEGLMDHVEAMTPEQKKKWQEDLAESMKEWRKKREEEEKKKLEPPKAPIGKCVVCGGVVTGRYEKRWRDDGRIGGPPKPSWWKFMGLNCQKCGLRYEFLPPEDVVKS